MTFTLTPLRSFLISAVIVALAAIAVGGCEHGSAPLWETQNRQAH